MILVALFLVLAQDAPTLAVTLAPPATAVKQGEPVAVGVYLRNSGDKPLELAPPIKILANVASTVSTQPVELALRGTVPDARALGPGETIYAEYALALPPKMSGRLVLTLEKLSAAPVVIEVLGEGAAAGTKPAPAGQDSGTVPEGELPPAPPLKIAEHTPQHFSAHEPNYFLVGDRPTARFQFSFKYQFIDSESAFGTRHPWLSSLRFGYTQTSLWDIAGSSQPFTDSSYRPEFFFSRDKLDGVKLPFVKQFGLETGFQHESNGRDGDDSRGYNALYVRPILFLGETGSFDWRVMPKIYAYLSEDGTEDLEKYRGWVDLKIVAGKIDNLEIAALGRMGSGWDYGSLQLDATYPLTALTNGTVDIYLQMQYFTGYGESLLTYDEYTQSLRVGIALSR